MSSSSPLPTELFSAERLIERTWAEFGRKTLSQGALYVLWGSFESAEELSDRYFDAKGQKHLLDKRRRLNEEEVERVENVKELARQALDYRNWARTEAGNPIFCDVLVKDPDDTDGAKFEVAPSNHWPIGNDAFRLRNKILHQNGYLDVQIEIADQAMYAGDDIQLDARVVKRVHGALSGLMSPLDPLPF